jgi:hypothetical protein
MRMDVLNVHVRSSVVLCVQLMNVGKAHSVRLVYDRRSSSNFRLIYRFLLDNDPLMSLINQEFTKRYPVESKNGSMLIDDWNPTDIECESIIERAGDELLLSADLTRQDILDVIKGPIQPIDEYYRMQSNLTTFTTRAYEARHHSRCTRRMIKYRSGDDEHMYAEVEHMFQLRSHSVTAIAKQYKLLVIHNYEQSSKHASELPCVRKTRLHDNIQDYTPVIQVDTVHPYNVAAWPAGAASEFSDYLMVQISPANDDTQLAEIKHR